MTAIHKTVVERLVLRCCGELMPDSRRHSGASKFVLATEAPTSARRRCLALVIVAAPFAVFAASIGLSDLIISSAFSPRSRHSRRLVLGSPAGGF